MGMESEHASPAAPQASRIVTRLVAPRAGAMPLASLAAFLANLDAALVHSARFVLGEDKGARLIAQRMAKSLHCAQSGPDGLQVVVEVPQAVLRQGDLFGAQPVTSADVCAALFGAIGFLSQVILDSEQPFDDPALAEETIALFDIDLLEALTGLLIDASPHAIDFSVQTQEQARECSIGALLDERTARLKDYLGFVHAQLRAEPGLDVTGHIVELRSRDPAANRNHVRIVGPYHGDRTFVSALLTNEQYQLALHAHRDKSPVRLRGNGVRLSTQIRLTDVHHFSAAPAAD